MSTAGAPRAGEIAIRTEGLRKVYRSGFLRRPFVGLEGLDLEVRRGEVFGYIGPNGAGKTTTIKLLMGLNFPSGGRAEVLGFPAGSPRSQARVGFLPERPYFYDYLTGEEFLHFYGALHGIPASRRREKIDELLPLVHMERARKVQLRKFSKGMLQRIGVAQALINDPELVVLDEPSSGLDPMGRMLIRDLIAGLKRRGVTVMFSSHILSDVEQICDRVGIIHGGRMTQLGRVDELVGATLHSVEVTFADQPSLDGTALGVGAPRFRAQGRVAWDVDSVERANRLVRDALALGASLLSVVPRRETLEDLFVDEMSAVSRQSRDGQRLPE
jgi:ABC-2 type transport system ATP-binding protein